MTERELIVNMINHKNCGTFPTELWITTPAKDNLIKYLGVKNDFELHKELGIALIPDCNLSYINEKWEKWEKLKFKEDSPFGEKRYIWHDNKTFEDLKGVVYKTGSDTRYVQWVRGPLSDMEEPNADAAIFFSDENLLRTEMYKEKVEKFKKEGLFTRIGFETPFKVAWQQRGFENFLMDYYLHTDFVEKIFKKYIDEIIPQINVAIKAGVDLLCFGGDVAMQDRVLMGPEKFREFDKVVLKKIIDYTKTKKPDIYFFFHSDGDITSIMDDLLEIGFDFINPMQPECMDITNIKKVYGDKIVMHGCGSLQKTLPFGSTKDVENEVKYIIDNCGKNGGLVIMPSNVIDINVPPENIVTFYKTAKEYYPYE